MSKSYAPRLDPADPEDIAADIQQAATGGPDFTVKDWPADPPSPLPINDCGKDDCTPVEHWQRIAMSARAALDAAYERLSALASSPAPAGLEDISDAVTEATSAMAHALPVIVAVRAWRDTVRSPRDPRLSQRLDQAILDAIGDFDEYAATQPAEDSR